MVAGSLVIHAVVAKVTDYADHHIPRHEMPFMNPLADGCAGAAPLLPGKVFGNNDIRPQAVDIGPSEVASCNHACAQSLKVTRRSEVEEPNRRVALISLSFHIKEIPVVAFSFHGSECRQNRPK